MALNSLQKKYVKKNVKNLTVEEMAEALGVSPKEITTYVKKRWDKKKSEKIILRREEKYLKSEENLHTLDSFSLRRFFINNYPVFILLFCAVFIVYFNALGNGFVSDDLAAIPENKNIGQLGSIFAYHIGYVQRFLHFIAYHLGGGTPGYFHFINILFHLGSTFLVFILLSLLTKKRVAIFSACLFAVHPLLVEAVTWISGMPYTLYGFFFLLSFFFYLLSATNKKYFYYSLGAFLLALTSSEKAVTLVLIFPLYEMVFGNFKAHWKKSLVFAVLGLLLAVIYLKGVSPRLEDLETEYHKNASSLYNPVFQVPVALANYFGLFFWPHKLTLYHTETMYPFKVIVLFWMITLSYFSLIFYGWRKNKALFFWLAFFLITLLPTLTPLKIAWVVAERYAYLGALGLIVVFSLSLNWLLEKSDIKFRPVFYALAILLVVLLSFRSIVRNADWKNEESLWTATAKTSPSGPNIHATMGEIYKKRGELEKAEEEFKKAIEINPRFADGYHNLASFYHHYGRNEEAISNYLKAIEYKPRLWQAYQGLAGIYFNQGDYLKAQEYMKKALEIDPQNEKLQENMRILEAKL